METKQACRVLTFTSMNESCEAVDCVTQALGHPRWYAQEWDRPARRHTAIFSETLGDVVEATLREAAFTFVATGEVRTLPWFEDGFHSEKEYEELLKRSAEEWEEDMAVLAD